MNLDVAIIIISLVFSAYFSAVELAFISANRLHIALQHKKGHLWAAIITKFIDRPSLFITAMLIGNTIALVVYGIYMSQILDPQVKYVVENFFYLEGGTRDIVVLVLQSVLSTMLVLAVAEFMPKSVSLINPDKLLVVFALPTQLIYRLLYPFVYVIVSLTKVMIVKVLRLEYSEISPAFGLTDLDHYISNLSQNQDDSTDVDTKIFSNALEFKLVKVRDCMIPRTEIVAIDKAEGIETLREAFIKSGHSKIFVFEDSIDNMVGYCHCLELFKKPSSIDDILSPVMIVAETMPANELMLELIEQHKSVALVVDEFGGTAGIVTIEDIMEEIFGEIDDEYDEVEEDVRQMDHDTFVTNARIEIDRLNDHYKWQVPEGDYETLGGYILSVYENIPQENEVIETEDFIFTVVSMKDARIDQVKVVLKNPPTERKLRPVL